MCMHTDRLAGGFIGWMGVREEESERDRALTLMYINICMRIAFHNLQFCQGGGLLAYS